MKLEKIFVVSLLILTIVTIGAVNASEDISEDTNIAIDPTVEAISQSVDVEATDDVISQSVDDVVTAEETTSDSVEEIEAETNTDDNTLSDGEEELLSVEFYDSEDRDGKVLSIESNTDKSGRLKVYIDDQEDPYISWGVDYGEFMIPDPEMEYYTAKNISFSPTQLELSNGTHNLNVKFFDEDNVLQLSKTGQVTFIAPLFEIEFFDSYFEDYETFVLYLNSLTSESGDLYIYVDNETEAKITYSIVDGDFDVLDEEGEATKQKFMYVYPSDLNLKMGPHNLTVKFVQNGETLFNKTGELVNNIPYLVVDTCDVRYIKIGDVWKDNCPLVHFYIQDNTLNGNVTLYINNDKKLTLPVNDSKFENGNRIIDIFASDLGLDFGEYIVEVSFNNGTEEDKIANKNVNYNAIASLEYKSHIINTEEDCICQIEYPKYTGTIDIYYGKIVSYPDDDRFEMFKLASASIKNGIGNVTLSGLEEGYCELYYKTGSEGDYIYIDGLTVVKNSENVTVSISATDITLGQNVVVKFTSKDKSTLYLIIDGNERSFKNTNSVTEYFAGLGLGTHTLEVKFDAREWNEDLGRYVGDVYAKTFTINVKASSPTPTPSPTPSTQPSKKIIKKATKIVAKKKTFKVKTKVKKYTITLKSGKKLLKKVKVTLKIKGKIYKAKTNSKGKATFKIKNLKKKGKYTAVIKFAGNKYYKKSSKKVRITVKK